MNILFSPLGMTDPISGGFDGAMLHICRNYEIDKVYMFMSKEICEISEKDNRYVKALEKLSNKLGRKIDYEIIPRPNLVNVQWFDKFIDEFEPLIEKIKKDYPKATIYFNVSSGTPAMKSALQTISAFDNEYIPIQVSTPAEKSNYNKGEDKSNFNIEEEWEKDVDNLDGFVNRCKKSDYDRVLAKMKKRMLRSLIEKYDYSGAEILAKDKIEGLSEEAKSLIKAAHKRITLSPVAESLFSKTGDKAIVEKDKEIEYLLMLDIKVRREEYSDFLRGVTPLTTVLFEKILKYECGFDVKDYVDNTPKGNTWNLKKLKNNQIAYKVLIDKPQEESGFKNINVYTSHTNKLIQGLSKDDKLKELCKNLRETEIKRNKVAHQITSVSYNAMKDELGMTPEEIVNALYEACTYCNFDLKTKKELFKSYDKMNKRIIDCIEKVQ